MARLVLIAAVIASALNGVAVALQPAAEFLKVENPTSEPLIVHIRATGQGTKVTGWQEPIRVSPGEVGSIQLVGFEPFDISIRGIRSATLFKRVKLCTYMRACAETGETEWTIGGQAFTPGPDGKLIVAPDPQRIFHADIDDTNVKLHYFPLAGQAAKIRECSFIVVNLSERPIADATLVFLDTTNQPLRLPPVATDSKGRAKAALPDGVDSFQTRVYKFGVCNDIFPCKASPNEIELKITERRAQNVLENKAG